MVKEIIIAVIAGGVIGTIVGFVQFMVTRHDNRHDILKDIKQSIVELREEFNRFKKKAAMDKADQSRRNILTASDEVTNTNIRHSKEWWDQLNVDITNYDRYCTNHKDYENNRAVQAIENLNRVYQKLLTEGFD